MKIALNAECYQLLLKHTPKDSRAYGALSSAIKVDGGINTVDRYYVDCVTGEEDVFVETAYKHFRQRAREVEHAIVTAAR